MYFSINEAWNRHIPPM